MKFAIESKNLDLAVPAGHDLIHIPLAADFAFTHASCDG